MQYTLAENNIINVDVSSRIDTGETVLIQYNHLLWDSSLASVSNTIDPFFVGNLYVFDNTNVPLYINEKFSGLKKQGLNIEMEHPSKWNNYRKHSALEGFIIPFSVTAINATTLLAPNVMTLATQYVNCPNPYVEDMHLAGISDSRNYYRTIMLQGVENTATDATFAGNSLRLVPHYPKVSTQQMFFALNFLTNYPSTITDGVNDLNGDEWEFRFERTGGSSALISNVYPTYPTFTARFRLDAPYNYDKLRWKSTIYTEEGELIPHSIDCIVAYFDECPADYYLMWQDRFGGIQCLGFYGRSRTSIDYKKISTISHKNLASLIGVEQQEKYTINTGWLDEWKFPYYESIFVSPTLYLYDVKNDKGLWVTLDNNTYTEKKFVNEKSLLSMELNLKAAEQKRISY